MLPSSAVADDMGRMLTLAQQGFHCSEILVFMGLEAQGKTDPDLIRAISALAGGIGTSGDICGAATGGACLLGLYAGRGFAEEADDPRLRIMISELLDWFSQEHEAQYGGIHCRDIIVEDPRNMIERCPRIVARVYRKVRSILADHGYGWAHGHLDLPPPHAGSACSAACPVAARL
jgi:C_GCAxxG_C_C family probable redox protein